MLPLPLSKAIVEAMTTDFSRAPAQTYYLLNAEDVESGWGITDEDNMAPGEKSDHYTDGRVRHGGLVLTWSVGYFW